MNAATTVATATNNNIACMPYVSCNTPPHTVPTIAPTPVVATESKVCPSISLRGLQTSAM